MQSTVDQPELLDNASIWQASYQQVMVGFSHVILT